MPGVGAVERADGVWRLLSGFVLIFAVYWFSAAVLEDVDVLVGSLLRLGATLVVVAVAELVLLGGTSRAIPARLGLGAPTSTALAAAVVAAVPMLLFYPLFTFATGAVPAPRADWLATYLGLVAVSGIAEEVMFRAYLFGHLRRSRSFRQAAFLSMLVFSAAHLLLFTRVSAPIAIAAILLAIVVSFPLAHLYELGANTIWACALLHSLAHTITVTTWSDEWAVPAALVFMLVAGASGYLVFLFRGNRRGSWIDRQTDQI